MISPSGQEVGPFLSIEQAALSPIVPHRVRTTVFAWYTLAGACATAVGALAAGFLANRLQRSWTPLDCYRAIVIGYARLGAVLLVIVRATSRTIEAPPSAQSVGARSPFNDGRVFIALRP